MSKIITTAVIGLSALLATTPGHTQPQVGRTLFFPSLFLVSDYRYQGQSLSDSEAVPQASLYAWRPDGYYGGLWLSGVDFNDPGNTSVELDTYLGRNIELAAGTLDLEVMYTAFDEQVPGPTYDFWQLKAGYSLQFGPWQATQLASWVPEASYGSGRVWRLESELRRPLAPWLDVHGQAGSGVCWIGSVNRPAPST